jgi:hypothetical protein
MTCHPLGAGRFRCSGAALDQTGRSGAIVYDKRCLGGLHDRSEDNRGRGHDRRRTGLHRPRSGFGGGECRPTFPCHLRDAVGTRPRPRPWRRRRLGRRKLGRRGELGPGALVRRARVRVRRHPGVRQRHRPVRLRPGQRVHLATDRAAEYLVALHSLGGDTCPVSDPRGCPSDPGGGGR